MEPTATATDPVSLWGTHTLALDASHSFELGKLTAEVRRSSRDWIVEYTYTQDLYVRGSDQARSRLRSVFSETHADLTIRPACADRNMVAVPVDTIHVSPGQRVTLYMSSPLWVQMLVQDGRVLVADLPCEILSDSWFGPNTVEGELCYSNQTSARMFLEHLPQRPERVVTPATFVNEGTDSITVDRFNLPLPLLSIYSIGGAWWTQEVVIRRSEALDNVEVNFTPQPPEHIGAAELAAAPRREESGSTITRTLSMLFG